MKGFSSLLYFFFSVNIRHDICGYGIFLRVLIRSATRYYVWSGIRESLMIKILMKCLDLFGLRFELRRKKNSQFCTCELKILVHVVSSLEQFEHN